MMLGHREDQILTVCAQQGSPSGVSSTFSVLNPHFIGVQFHHDLNRWMIANLDGSPMPAGAAFAVCIHDISILGDSHHKAFVHRTDAANTRDVVSYIDLPTGLNAPRFEKSFPGWIRQLPFMITPRLPSTSDLVRPPGWLLPSVMDLAAPSNWIQPPYRPHSVSLASMNHPIGTWFDEREYKWAIFNADFQPMPIGVEFNVMLEAGHAHGSGCDHYTWVVASGSSGSAQRFCLSPCQGGFTFFITQNPSYRYAPCLSRYSAPGNTTPSFCTSPLGVRVTPRRVIDPANPLDDDMSIVSQDGVSLSRGAGFNVIHLNDDTKFYSP